MPYLVITNSDGKEEIHALEHGHNTIGRHPDNHICNSHLSLSRHHAEIILEGQKVILIDKDSRNGTFVNNLRIQRCELKDGDEIRFGELFARYVHTSIRSDFDVIKTIQHDITDIKELIEDNPQRSGSAIKLRSTITLEERNLAKLNILLQIGRELGAMTELEPLLAKLLDLLFQIMEVERGAILLVNPETGLLEPKAVKTRHTDRHQRIYSQRIVNFIFRTGNAIISNNPQLDSRFPQMDTTDSIVMHAITGSMGVPLKINDRAIGVLYVDNINEVSAYTEEDLDFLAAIAGQATVAIKNALLSEKIRTAAILQAKFARFFPRSVIQQLMTADNIEIVESDVTIVFADITNFTELSSAMPPRQVIAMLNQYFTVMVEDIIFPYEGTLEKYIGDALLAVWGAPYQKPDDAERALRASIAMQKALIELNQLWQKQHTIPPQFLPLQIHIGIHSGIVAAGNIGSPQLIQYATIGDTTNLTNRICNEAKGGEILLSQSTVDRLDRMFMTDLPLEKLPPTYLKGKTNPIQLYRLHWQNVP
ncbi:MAG: adenylate/guanylate cyclase domain-containing protein [Pseudanabaenaceae cyanobacterium]